MLDLCRRGLFHMLILKMSLKCRSLTFEVKGVILDKLDRGVRVCSLAREYNVNESTIRTIRKNADKVRASLCAGNVMTSWTFRSAANVVLAKTEKLLLLYLDRQGRVGIGTDNTFLREKALEYYSRMAIRMNVENPILFAASKGWLNGFKLRHHLSQKKFAGETVSADDKAAQDCPK